MFLKMFELVFVMVMRMRMFDLKGKWDWRFEEVGDERLLHEGGHVCLLLTRVMILCDSA